MPRHPLSLAAAFIVLASLTPAAAQTGAAARVNGVEVPMSAFDREMEVIEKRAGRFGATIDDATRRQFRRSVLHRLVDEELLRQELERAQVTVSEAELDRAIATWKASVAGNPGGYEAALADSGTTLEQFREGRRRELALRKHFEHAVTPEAVRASYERDRERRYTVREKVHASHILIKAEGATAAEDEAKKKIQRIYKLAKKRNADFAELAKTHSEGPSGPRGGDLGEFTRGRMVQPFEDAAFATKVGRVSKPVRTRFGWHILKVHKRTKAHVKSFDEVKGEIEARLDAQLLTAARANLLHKLRANAQIELLID